MNTKTMQDHYLEVYELYICFAFEVSLTKNTKLKKFYEKKEKELAPIQDILRTISWRLSSRELTIN